ncbi:MAG: ABC transporter ATP-binding protein [Deltaproteobacteria bacterium]|nr:ABC transporter ATP-binding protein [Deltaproteobacteria bacterium]
MTDVTLAVEGLAVRYGHIQAVQQVDLEVRAGEIVALIGANGAGKTTTLNAVSGLLKPSAGAISFEGKGLGRLRPQEIVRRGLIQVPEGRAILTTLSVRENLELGAYSRRDRREAARDLEAVMNRFPILRDRASLSAGNLSGGEQQMLAIGRALMGRPRLLLLDEPSMGLAPLVVQEIFLILQEINRAGTSLLLVEQNARQALRVAHRGYVLETGRTVLTDTGERLLGNPRVVEAYLGG